MMLEVHIQVGDHHNQPEMWVVHILLAVQMKKLKLVEWEQKMWVEVEAEMVEVHSLQAVKLVVVDHNWAAVEMMLGDHNHLEKQVEVLHNLETE